MAQKNSRDKLEMVGEFADLQGLIGHYYAVHDGEDMAVAAAVQDHYSPLGPTDQCPSDPVSVVVALALLYPSIPLLPAEFFLSEYLSFEIRAFSSFNTSSISVSISV